MLRNVSYVDHTTRDNTSPTHPGTCVVYVGYTLKKTLDNRRSRVVGEPWVVSSTIAQNTRGSPRRSGRTICTRGASGLAALRGQRGPEVYRGAWCLDAVGDVP
jgi:hypothetical protein